MYQCERSQYGHAKRLSDREHRNWSANANWRTRESAQERRVRVPRSTRTRVATQSPLSSSFVVSFSGKHPQPVISACFVVTPRSLFCQRRTPLFAPSCRFRPRLYGVYRLSGLHVVRHEHARRNFLNFSPSIRVAPSVNRRARTVAPCGIARWLGSSGVHAL